MIPTHRNTLKSLLAAIAVLAVALALAACGSTPKGGGAAGAPDYDTALKGAPAPLSKLYSKGDAVLDGGVDAYKAQLAALKGYPVVVNKWASWCGPCREEYPLFQELSARYGKKVAFVGVDGQDSKDSAKGFLAEFPVPYPSFSDPDLDIAQEIGGTTTGFPQTLFIGADGQTAYLKQGPYLNAADFEADIQRYLLSS